MPSYSIASGSYDGRVRVYDLRMGSTSVDVVAHPVTSVRCSADGNALLASTLDGRIRMLDRADGKLLQGFGGTPSTTTTGTSGNGGGPVYRNEELRIRSVLAKGDAIVLSGSEAEKKDRSSQAFVFAWDVLSGEVVAAIPAGEGVRAVSCVAWNEKRGQWAGGCSDGIFHFSFGVVWVSANQEYRVCEGLWMRVGVSLLLPHIYRTHASNGIERVTAPLHTYHNRYAAMGTSSTMISKKELATTATQHTSLTSGH